MNPITIKDIPVGAVILVEGRDENYSILILDKTDSEVLYKYSDLNNKIWKGLDSFDKTFNIIRILSIEKVKPTRSIKYKKRKR